MLVTTKDAARFLARLKAVDGGCIEYQGVRNAKGYGQFALHGVMEQAHRVAWIIAGQSLTEANPHVLHRCDNPACCNPLHLFAGSNGDNVADRVKKDRSCKSRKGYPFGATLLPSGRWQSGAKVRGKRLSFGTYDTAEEASRVAREMQARHLADSRRAGGLPEDV